MELTLFILVCVAMAMDIVTGYALACKEHNVSSSKMREGLWHKLAWMGIIGVAWFVQMAGEVLGRIDPALIQPASGLEVIAGVGVTGICALCLWNELVSVVENLCAINPDINDKLGRAFKNTKREQEAKTLIDPNKGGEAHA